MAPSNVRRTMLTELAWTMLRAEDCDVSADLRKTLEEQIAAVRWLLEQTGLYDEERLARYMVRARLKRAA